MALRAPTDPAHLARARRSAPLPPQGRPVPGGDRGAAVVRSVRPRPPVHGSVAGVRRRRQRRGLEPEPPVVRRRAAVLRGGDQHGAARVVRGERREPRRRPRVDRRAGRAAARVRRRVGAGRQLARARRCRARHRAGRGARPVPPVPARARRELARTRRRVRARVRAQLLGGRATAGSPVRGCSWVAAGERQLPQRLGRRPVDRRRAARLRAGRRSFGCGRHQLLPRVRLRAAARPAVRVRDVVVPPAQGARADGRSRRRTAPARRGRERRAVGRCAHSPAGRRGPRRDRPSARCGRVRSSTGRWGRAGRARSCCRPAR